MNVFIVFVKFLSWIVAIWVILIRLIEEKGSKVLKGGSTTKMIYIITINKNKNKNKNKKKKKTEQKKWT